MPWFVPASRFTSSESALTLFGSSDLFVSAGVTLASNGGDGLSFSTILFPEAKHQFIVHGTVIGVTGMSFIPITISPRITVGMEGRVTGHSGNGIKCLSESPAITNHGVIESLDGNFAAIRLDRDVPGSEAGILNTGMIEGVNFGIQSAIGTGTLRLDNRGTVQGAAYAFRDEENSTDTILNSGRIIGDVQMGGGNDRFDGRGGRLDGELFGGPGRDRLISGADGDRMHGGAGQDTLTGGGGADRFVFDATPGIANADDITDFGAADRILLQDTNFRVLPQGALAAGAFRANASGLAGDGNDRIIYETDTGWLRYDVDGRGGASAFRFAHLDADLRIDAGDFLVI